MNFVYLDIEPYFHNIESHRKRHVRINDYSDKNIFNIELKQQKNFKILTCPSILRLFFYEKKIYHDLKIFKNFGKNKRLEK